MHSKSIINGHFDPLTISIYETAPDESWRGHMDALLQHRKKAGKIIEDWKTYADLTNKHEHDHFIRHTSSEYGVLYTLILILKHSAKSNYILGSHEYIKHPEKRESRKAIQVLLSNICFLLFENAVGIKQKDAVYTLNELYRICFGIDNLFVTRLPEAPACPFENFGYQNILETSAIINEFSAASILGLTDSNLNEFLRVKERDNELYFSLFNILRNQINNMPACKMLCHYALDIRVPLFVSEINGQIHWEQIHPGWRLYNFIAYLKKDLSSKGFIDLLSKYKSLEFHAHMQATIFYSLESLSNSVFNQNTFYACSVKNSPINESIFLERLLPSYRDYLMTIMKEYGGVIEHLFFSHNAFRQECASYPLNFHSKAFAEIDGELQFDNSNKLPENIFNEELAKSNLLSKSSALYTVQGGKIGSVHWKNNIEGVSQAINLKLKNIVINCLFNKSSKEEAMRQILEYGRFELNDIQHVHINNAKIIIEKYYSSYKL